MPKVNPTTSAPKVVSNPMRMSWRNIILGFFIGTTLIGAGMVAFYYFELKNVSSTSQTPQINFSKPKTTTQSANPEQPKVVTDETADWSVYKNQELGFQLKYPSEVSTEFVARSSGKNNILGIKGPTQKQGTEFHDGLAIWVKNLEVVGTELRQEAINDQASIKSNEGAAGFADSFNYQFTLSDIKVGKNISAVKQTYNFDPDIEFVYIVNISDPNEPKLIRISAAYKGGKKEEYKSLYSKILSTFKFLD